MAPQTDHTDDYLVWIDIETTGLDVAADQILEVGYIITDLDLKLHGSADFRIWDRSAKAAFDSAVSWVQETHTANGLIQDCETDGMTLEVAETLFAECLEEDFQNLGIKKPAMVGSSVQFDRENLREWMPKVEKLFTYRNIDNSTTKELCRRFNPEVAQKLEETLKPAKLHRVISDLYDSIEEFKFYAQNFMFTTRGV